MGPELLIPLVIVLFWPLGIAVSVLAAHLGGWHELAIAYRSPGRFDGRRWRFRSARLQRSRSRWIMGRRIDYSNCLTIGAASKGLHLSILLPFRAGHPPLLIPWDDITVAPLRVWLLIDGMRLDFAAVPEVSLVISRKLWNRLKEHAGAEFGSHQDQFA